MNVTEVVATVAALGKEFQDQQNTIDAMNSLLGVLCDDELKKHISEVGIRTFLGQPDRSSNAFQKARRWPLLKESTKKKDADSLP